MRTRKIHAVGSNLRGNAVGQWHPHARHPDSLVNEVRALRATGLSYRAIARSTGVHFATVGDWCRGRRRGQAPARFIARPVRESSDPDDQSALSFRASEQGADARPGVATVTTTDKVRV